MKPIVVNYAGVHFEAETHSGMGIVNYMQDSFHYGNFTRE